MAKSLRNLSQDGVLAQVHEQWPLTRYDLDVRILQALGRLFPSLAEKAFEFHGARAKAAPSRSRFGRPVNLIFPCCLGNKPLHYTFTLRVIET